MWNQFARVILRIAGSVWWLKLILEQNAEKVKPYWRKAMEPTPKKLLDQVRDVIRLKHYSIRTGQELLGHKACPEPVEGTSNPR